MKDWRAALYKEQQTVWDIALRRAAEKALRRKRGVAPRKHGKARQAAYAHCEAMFRKQAARRNYNLGETA